MFCCARRLARTNKFLILKLGNHCTFLNVFEISTRYFSTLRGPVECYPTMSNIYFDTAEKCNDFELRCNIDDVIAKVCGLKSEDEVFQCLMREYNCKSAEISCSLIDRLLNRFRDDWKSALGIFRWVKTCSADKPLPESYDKLVDILGKMKKMEMMMALVEEMNGDHLVSLNTVAKVMRRFAGAGEWKQAVKIFDELEKFGLKKNTESMNLLLDTLCKENRVEQARAIFLELKSHIPPNANTFNIFIHGWCKMKRIEEAYWTIQEIKGHGFRPSVISYSTIIQFYCFQCQFWKVYELLDEMEAQECPPNVVTFTTIMHCLTKAGEFKEALQVAERMKLAGCKPDVLFYNALIHTLRRAGFVEDAIYVFTKDMPHNKIIPNTSTFNTMIAMFCHHGQEQRAGQYLRDLENSPYCKPDVQSFYPLIKSCFKAGKTGDCLTKLLDSMVKKHHLCPDLATYTLLIHGLCRKNSCEWAYHLFRDMITQGLKPRYLTCSLLLKEIKEKKMYDEVEWIEDYVKKME
ncbi:pentatricopeptide repeat-containing protein mitochondrial-like [Dorcoceras hygrometricum]|uniref:Pentatricopeptide repeat-containing protein mitochondrial-like n=1 Tax=Dorcoceras hygrometricum TaxID=472368 RepID=A0A2Z7AQU8_9LAMI|nr:pentatricopeptide repeat-containing protein mitochondrial-like [Dorcoceras hygrometricum]